MLRFVILFFFAGLYLIGSACYDLYVQAGTSRQPTTVSMAELRTSVPGNRHLIVTGGRADTANAVAFYKTKWGTKVSGSEILFIPITDASTTASRGSIPSVLLRITGDQTAEAKAGNKVSFEAIEGVRTTSLDLEDKARRRLVETYGQAAVDRMMILNYHGGVGIGAALGKLIGGIALTGAVVGGFIFLRKSKQPIRATVGSIPPRLPTGPA